jgi:MFS family permease
MEPTDRITFSQYLPLIRDNANFRRLWFAQIVSEIGDWMYTVAIYSQLLALTGLASSISAAFILQVLPQALASPMIGVLNDRLSRRKLMIAADLARAVIVALMMIAQFRGMIWLIYVLLFFETVFWGLFEPGRSAVIPNITTGRETLVANSLSSITWSFNFTMGFAIGGFIAALAGPFAVFTLNSFSFLLSAFFIYRMTFVEPHLHQQPPLRARELLNFSPIAEGFRYVRQDKRLLVTMLAKFGLGFMGANWTLVTLLGDRKFPVSIAGMDAKSAGMLGMSILMGARGLGALIGPAAGAYLSGSNQRRMRLGIALGFGLGALGYIVLGQAPNMLVASACLVLAHAGGSLIWVFSTTLLQLNTDDKFRGRVFSSEFAFMTISMSASNALAGTFIDAKVPVETMTSLVGAAMIIPGVLWVLALRLWR